jgi:PAS domain S-box-containing protein
LRKQNGSGETMSVGFDNSALLQHDELLVRENSVATPEQVRRRSEVLVALGRRAIAAPSWRMLAHDAAALIAETLETEMFAVAELSDDRSTLTVRVASTGDEHQDVNAPANLIPYAEATSLAGFALSVAQPVAVTDFSKEHRFQDLLLRQRGAISAAAMPLLRGNAAFGALIIASQKPRFYSSDELQYFETIAHLVSTSIAHDKVRDELEQERRFHSVVLDSTVSLMLVLSPAGNILQTNRATVKSLGFELRELVDRPFSNTLLIAEEVGVVQQGLGQVASAINPLMMETWAVCKSGERRRIQWSLAGITDGVGKLERVVLTGIDVTRQREIEAELAQARGEEGESDENQPFRAIPQGPKGDRRVRTRRTFPYVQLIAPMIDGQMPDDHRFRPVRCRDISPTGFSFLSPTPPDFQDLMVALGGETTTTYMAARVMHATIVERDNQIAYIVGCRYLARAKNGEEPK